MPQDDSPIHADTVKFWNNITTELTFIGYEYMDCILQVMVNVGYSLGML